MPGWTQYVGQSSFRTVQTCSLHAVVRRYNVDSTRALCFSKHRQIFILANRNPSPLL